MDGYLLDTNVLQYLYNESAPEHPAVECRMTRIRQIAPAELRVENWAAQ